MTVIDEAYWPQLKSAMKFAEMRSFCQISTVSHEDGRCLPKSRTVMLYHLEDRGAFRMTCSTRTKKWPELQKTPKITGLYLDNETYTQYRFEADALLIDKSAENERALYQSSWASIRQDLRHVLWQEYLNDASQSYDINNISPDHGTILFKPYYWDIFSLNLEDFSMCKRVQMHLKNGEWKVYDNASRICSLDILR